MCAKMTPKWCVGSACHALHLVVLSHDRVQTPLECPLLGLPPH